MQIIDYNTGRYAQPCVLLLGYYDGVHIGHRALIACAKQLAKRAGIRFGIMTFYDGKNGAQIYPFSERIGIFEELGVDFVLAAQFDEAFRATPSLEFLQHVCSILDVKGFVCGQDFTFGKRASGNVGLLRTFAKERGIIVRTKRAVPFGNEIASTSLAKRLLDQGDVVTAAQLLAQRYFISGTVATEGRKVGRRIGFPTVNLHLSEAKYPIRHGVYAVTVYTGYGVFRGIANYGNRPTFDDFSVVLEVYIDRFSGDLYGKEIVVKFDDYIRDIRKFESGEQLAAQLTSDLEKIR